ncbi:helix-turn-helix domain-containing protein [Aurantiacibacter xanthus]|uniref:Helix-turn-helix domain-containing protein n=1 Tax=Aurantiacibacter xanthus TaxID=1784712 RepID=A0A3A1P5Z0_9SPHN|nr:helix-turn-helix domain-containing protein [Aurantiacibacter xanthus]RIV82233.1 helix-turn-helix domain-containing protein [Aurantiacibacter xanthus]
MLEQISSGSGYECNSFALWKDMVCDTFVDLDCVPMHEGQFYGKLKGRQLLDIGLVKVAAVPHSARRDKTRIARSSDDVFLLSLVSRGSMTVVQNDRTAQLGPGDFALYDTREPYQIILDQPFEQIVLRIRSKDIANRLTNASAMTARRVSGREGAGKLASTFIRGMTDQIDNIPATSTWALRDSMLDLMASALKEFDGETTLPAREGQHQLLCRVLQFVEENLHDERLSCLFIAERLNISGRYLRKLFQDRNHSLSEWIWHRRLEEARRYLSSQQSAQRSITAISYDLGFKDPAHFSKAFKSKYGQTPRECRYQR